MMATDLPGLGLGDSVFGIGLVEEGRVGLSSDVAFCDGDPRWGSKPYIRKRPKDSLQQWKPYLAMPRRM